MSLTVSLSFAAHDDLDGSLSDAALRFPEVTSRVVSARAQHPIWIDESGWTALGGELLQMLDSAADEGLEPDDYHYRELSAYTAGPVALVLEQERIVAARQRLECLLTDAYLGLAVDLAGGRIGQSMLPQKWLKEDRLEQHLVALQQVLIEDLVPGSAVPAQLGLQTLYRQHPQYARLRAALQRNRTRLRSARWLRIPDGLILRPGELEFRVPWLRHRLVASGDHVAGSPVWPGSGGGLRALTYDEDLVAAVKGFQKRHGLNPDGLVGERTLAALNVPLAVRVQQIQLNLERLRWLPADLGELHIRVNIPDFTLRVQQETTTLLTMRAVVGRQRRPTPVLSGAVSSLVLNPYWNVPQKLAREDLLPKVLADSLYLAAHDFRIYENWSPGAVELDPAGLDWRAVVPWDMAYKFRQSPGTANPLGRIKFMFDNPFSVFIHDTNHKGRFDDRRRSFSSGCIRIEDPEGLARVLLAESRQSAPADSVVTALLASPENRRFRLRRPVPVHLLYLTCWVDDTGTLQYREDIYGYDLPLTLALASRSSGGQSPVLVVASEAADEEMMPAREAGNYQVLTGPVSTWTKPGP